MSDLGEPGAPVVWLGSAGEVPGQGSRCSLSGSGRRLRRQAGRLAGMLAEKQIDKCICRQEMKGKEACLKAEGEELGWLTPT